VPGGAIVLSVRQGIRVTETEREGQRPHRFHLEGTRRGAGLRAGADELETLSQKLRSILGDQELVMANVQKVAGAPELPVGVELSRKRRSTFELEVGKVAERARKVLEKEALDMGELLSKILLVDGRGQGKLLARVVRLFAGPGYMHLISMLVHRLVLSKLGGFDGQAGFQSVDSRRFAPAIRQYRNVYLLPKLRDLLDAHRNPSAKQYLDAFRVACVYAESRVGLDLASPVKLGKEELGSSGKMGNRSKAMERFEKGFDGVKEFTDGELNISRKNLKSYCNHWDALPGDVEFDLSPKVLERCIPDEQVLPMVAASKIITGNASELDADVVSNMLERMKAADDLADNFQLTDGHVYMSIPELLESQRPQALLEIL
jgi:hypothetical protein